MLVAALCAVGMAWAGAASAQGVIDASVSVQGAGRIISDGLPADVCDRTDNVDDRVTVSCGRVINNQPSADDENFTLALTAIPRREPGAQSFVRWEGCDAVNIRTCFLTTHVLVSRTAFPKAVFDDGTAPTVTVGAPSYSETAERTVSFPALAADEPSGTFECSVDVGPFAACAPTTPFTLDEGSHQVRARARDASGNLGSVSGPVSFRILDTQLVSGPPDFASSTSATFTFATLAGRTFDCSLDGAAFGDCGSASARTFDSLAEGEHTFRVRARDGADFDRVPIARTWTVDTVPPETSLDPNVGPDDGEVTTLLTAGFAIGASEPARLQCRLGPADFGACPSEVSFADLPFGRQRFDARAVDRAGNVDPTPAGRSWTVAAVDSDGDGFDQRTDCNERDPEIGPGRREVRGNAVDENCDGVALPFRRLRVALSHTFRAFARSTTLTKLQVKDVPRRATVRATCALGRKQCPGRARKPFAKRRAAGTVSLDRRYRGVRLKVGTTITVTVTKRGMIGAVKILRIRRSKAPEVTDRCLPPGARRPQRC